MHADFWSYQAVFSQISPYRPFLGRKFFSRSALIKGLGEINGNKTTHNAATRAHVFDVGAVGRKGRNSPASAQGGGDSNKRTTKSPVTIQTIDQRRPLERHNTLR